MVGLGVENDAPPVAIQPPLRDGVHLRWATRRDLAFPWFGFYLFRREREGDQKEDCLARSLSTLKVEKVAGPFLDLPGIGVFTSDRTLVLTEDFAPGSRPEVDMGPVAEGARTWLDFALPTGVIGWAANATVGFRKAHQRAVCWTIPENIASATTEKGFKFERKAFPNGGSRIVASLPTPCLTVTGEVTSGASVELDALDEKGVVVASQVIPAAERPRKFALNAETGIGRVVLRSRDGRLRLHRICRDEPVRPLALTMTALFRDLPTATVEIAGRPGDVVSASLSADRIDAVRFTSADGHLPDTALIDLCYARVAGRDSNGWRPLPKCPAPLTLPLTHSDYPASGGLAVDLAAAQTLALSRVRYGDALLWQPGFVDLHAQLVALVEGGPSGPPMGDAGRAVPLAGTFDPPEPDAKTPTMAGLHPLDAVLLASLHPAGAEMLGLAWVDETAVEGHRYDYLVVAALEAGARGAQAALALWKAGSPSVLGYVLMDRGRELVSALASPTDPRAYSLPGATRPVPGDPSASPTDATLVAGVRWTRPEVNIGILTPGAAVLYHLWREDRGEGADPRASTDLGTHLTAERPVLLGRRKGSPFSVPTAPSDWPPVELFRLDTVPAPAWYSYRVSGMDLFGRISPPAMAPWHQWSPMPSPRPWYYQDPEGGRAIHAEAVRLRDVEPPPAPAAVEATLLDPADPYVVRDGAYLAWRAALPVAVRDTLVGARVRWKWTRAQARQAPDATEFRVYFSPIVFGAGAPPLPPMPVPTDLVDTTGWSERVHVTGTADSTTVDADGNLWFDLFLPAPGGPPAVFPAGVPLVPDLSEPVVYGYFGVSAADDAAETTDDAQWASGSWGGRAGNESRVSAPAKVFRVLREKPAAPVFPAGPEKFLASPADWNARSYYTYRWPPASGLRVHVHRAVDQSVFMADWAQRPRTAHQTDDSIFPDPVVDGRWDTAKRQEVAGALNALNAFSKDEAGRALAFAAYAGLSDDALRVLASLPGTEVAFMQVTVVPLDPDAAANANRVGPDDAPGTVPDATVRSFLDTLPGRASNRYLYRAIYVDGANNRSALSLAGPPVYLPKVFPPRAPSMRAAIGGNLSVTLVWASNREPELAAYRVYRAATPDAARDVRSMTLVQTVSVMDPPKQRPAAVTWTDAPVPGLTLLCYRVTAVDVMGNESAPGAPVQCRATDTAPPAAPVVTEAIWCRDAGGGATALYDPANGLPAAVSVAWTGDAEGADFLLQRRSGPTGIWTTVMSWSDALSLLDTNVDEGREYFYRVQARRRTSKRVATSTPVAATGK